MSGDDGAADPRDPVEEILADCLDRSAVEVRDAVEAACREHPHLEEALRRRLGQLETLQFISTDQEVEVIDDGREPELPRPFGPYTLLREIGRGGQGAVYEAEDTRLARRVALKVLTHASFATDAMRRRFRREAEVASRLDHRGICPVYEFGAFEDTPYIAMRLVDGRPLGQDLDIRDRGALPRIVRVVERAARAAHAAHEAGLVHRDLKPDNILVTDDDEPVLLDFGLARDISGERSVLTQADVVLGTPSYMAPEQIQEAGDVDRRADIHALGVILFECVAGERPFRAPTVESIWRRITEEDAADPRTLNPAVPKDLAAVILTALEKRPERRYEDAAAMADDLLRVLRHEPVHARPPSNWVRCVRWVQRHPLVAGLLVTIALLLSIGFVSTLVLLGRANAANEETRAALVRTEGGTLLAQATRFLDSDPPLALALAVAGYDRLPTSRARSVVANALSRCRALRVVTEDGEGLQRVAISRDGKRWHAAFDGSVVHRDIESGALLPEEVLPARRGPRVKAEGKRGIRIVDTGPNRDDDRVVTLDGRPGAAVACETGAYAVVAIRSAWNAPAGERDSSVRIVETTTGDEVARFNRGPGAPAVSLAISPDGRRVSYGLANGQLFVASRAGGEQRIRGAGTTAVSMDFSADGQRLVVGFHDGVVGAWDLRGSSGLPVLRTNGEVTPVSFDATGERVLCAAGVDEAYVFEARRGGAVVRLGGHPRQVFPARWLADGRVVTGCADGKARVFDGDGTLSLTLSGHTASLFDVGVAADGRRVATACLEGTGRVFDAVTGETLAVLRGAEGELRFARFSPDGGRVATTSVDGVVRVHDAATGAVLGELRGHRLAVFFPLWLDERRLATTSDDRTVRIWDTSNGTSTVLAGHGGKVFWAAGSSDGSVLATTSFDRTVRIWDTATGTCRRVLTGHGGHTLDVAFSPDDRWVVSTSKDGTARVWDVESGEEHLLIDAHQRTVFHACFDPSGDWLATASGDGTVRLWPTAPVAVARARMALDLSEADLKRYLR